jgi:hypothetical protein
MLLRRLKLALQPACRTIGFQRVVAVTIETLERARTSAAGWQRQNHRGPAMRAHLRLISLSHGSEYKSREPPVHCNLSDHLPAPVTLAPDGCAGRREDTPPSRISCLMDGTLVLGESWLPESSPPCSFFRRRYRRPGEVRFSTIVPHTTRPLKSRWMRPRAAG